MYIVATIDFGFNELTQELFDFEGTLEEAYVARATCDFGFSISESDITTIEDVKQYYFDCDCAISILKI